MSGPIVRKYGFPNFEKIFGERPVEHGVDEAESSKQSESKGTELADEAGSKPRTTADSRKN